jgi:hypothetical protein
LSEEQLKDAFEAGYQAGENDATNYEWGSPTQGCGAALELYLADNPIGPDRLHADLTHAHAIKRPTVYWGMNTVALHYLSQGDRISKKTLMLELARSPENERLLVAMGNAGRSFLGLKGQ